MKKLLKILLLPMCLVLLCNLNLTKVSAEEITEEVVNTIVGQVYTYVEEDKNYSFTILDETKAECIVNNGEQTITITMEYTYENDILTFTMLGEKVGDFTIGENNVLSVYEISEDEIPEEIIQPCNVTLSYVENGKITFSTTEGQVGEVVEVYYVADLLYDLVEIKVNGVALTADEYGVYSFTLVEGENIVSAKFAIDDAKLEQVASLLNKLKEGNWEELLTVSNLMQFISWVITLGCSSGFFITLYKAKKYKQITPTEIGKKVDDKIEEVLGGELANFLKNVFGPFSEQMLEKFDKMENSTKTLVKCFVLMQENTPESRLAILNELNTLNSKETGELVSQIKTLIAEEVKKQEAKSQKLIETIEDLKNETSLEVTEPTHL